MTGVTGGALKTLFEAIRDGYGTCHTSGFCLRRAEEGLALIEAEPSDAPEFEVTDEMVTAAMRAFEPMSSVLRYREKDKWHTCDIMAMRDTLRAVLPLLEAAAAGRSVQIAAGDALKTVRRLA